MTDEGDVMPMVILVVNVYFVAGNAIRAKHYQ